MVQAYSGGWYPSWFYLIAAIMEHGCHNRIPVIWYLVSWSFEMAFPPWLWFWLCLALMCVLSNPVILGL